MKKLLLTILIFIISTTLLVKAEELQNIVYLELEEVSEEPGLVSTLAKRFRLIYHHDPNFVPAETLADFNQNNSPLLNNLQIIRRDLNRETKNPKNIRSDYSFTLEADSSASTKYENFVETHYLSNIQVIKKASRLNFKLDLFNYLDDQQDIETRGLNMKTNLKYDIKSLELEFSSIVFNGDSLIFSSANEDKNSKIISQSYEVLAELETSLNLSDSVKNIKFKEESASGKRISAKIKKDGSKGKQSCRLIPQIENDEISIASLGNGNYKFVIPIEYQSKKKLSSSEKILIENMDLLIMPLNLDIKTGDNRDLNISGILRDKLSIFFDNGNTSSNKIK